jgi:polysaccharide biosynthesis transport protein
VSNIFPHENDSTMIHPRLNKLEWGFDVPDKRRFEIRQFLFGFFIVIAIGICLWPILPRYYQAQATLIYRSPEQAGKFTFLKQDLDEKAIQSEIDILSSAPLTAEVVKRLNLQNDREITSSLAIFPLDFISNAFSATTEIDPARSALTRLSVQHDRRSYTIRLGYLSKDPQKSANMTATLASLYLENITDRKQKLLERDVDIARSRLLSTTFRQNQLTASINELSQLPPSQEDKSAIAELISEKARLAQASDVARAQIEEALARQQNTEPDAELIAPARFPAGPLFPNPMIFAVALLIAASVSGVLCGVFDAKDLIRIFKK